MKTPHFAALLCILLLTIGLNAQSPSPSPVFDDVVKITTKLVQIDAVVTDKNGKSVPGLTPADFELFQDGQPQKITNLTYVNAITHASIRVPTDPKRSGTTVAPPPVPASRAGEGRLLTFIVDDGNCSASTTGMRAAREGLKKFINEQMLPGDRVAIFRTRGGSSMMQQYLSDKSQLLRTAEQIRWYPPGGGCNSSDGSFFEPAKSNILDKIGPGGQSSTAIESDDDRKTREHAEDFNRNNQVNGSTGVINYVVRGLERVGGRKIVFFMSDGLQIRGRDGNVLSAADALRELTERANRASVVFNTVDVRGLYSSSMIDARDEVRTQADVNSSDKVIANRDQAVRLSEDGMYYLAEGTSGRFYKNANNLDEPIAKALGQEEGYYLIAYEPSDETFKGKHFNKIEVKVKRPQLTVKSRPGFDAVVDQPVKNSKRAGESDLYDAIAAPLPTAGLNVQLTAFFGNSAAEGNFVRSLMHLSGDEITFADDPSGMKKAVFDVVAVTLDEKNKVVDEFTRTHTFKVPADALPMIRQNGLIYSTDVPIAKPGTYNFRVAVRDNSSSKIGSSGQVLDIPDLKKTGIFLSGLSISQVGDNGKFVIPGQVKPENAITMTSTTAAPAIREFHRGTVVAYSYTIYNARLDPSTHMPNVSVQMKLYKDGNLISDGKPAPAQFEKQADWTRVIDFAYLRLNSQIDTGDYTLQIIVKDLLASDKNAVSSQYLDFNVLP